MFQLIPVSSVHDYINQDFLSLYINLISFKKNLII